MNTRAIPRFRTLDLTLVSMFAALMAIGANITSFAPFLEIANIPLSMQPFFAILAGLLLGSRLGAMSMTVYMLIGIAGAPVFAQFGAGIGAIMGSSGGFILAYIPTAYVVGKMMEAKQKPTLSHFMIASLVGIMIIYLIGTNYMYISLNIWLEVEMSYASAWIVMAWFGIKDLIFTIFGAFITPRIYSAINQSTSFSRPNNKSA